MEIMWDTELYCLVGDPINFSLSPIIHNYIFKILNRNSVYLAFNIEEKKLKKTINTFKSLNVKGFNVTIPHKKKIIKYLDEISPEAEKIGAVNTVKNQNGKFIGYNTDGHGFIKTFKDNNIALQGKNILLIGAGGAANSIASSLLMEDVKKLYISNRSKKNANSLKERISPLNIETEIEIVNIKYLDKNSIDIIINSTPIGMYPMENKTPLDITGFTKNTIVYDIIYKPKNTQLLKDAKTNGLTTFNGKSMLLNQAILSQNIWFNTEKKINFKNFKEIEGVLAAYVE